MHSGDQAGVRYTDEVKQALIVENSDTEGFVTNDRFNEPVSWCRMTS